MGTVAKLNSVVSTTTIVNTTTETDLYSFTLPSNLLGFVGNSARLTAVGDILNNSAGAQTVTIRIKLGTTTLLTTPAMSFGNSANRRKWFLEVDCLAATTSAQRMRAELQISDASTDTFATDSTDGLSAVGYGTAAETGTNALDLKVTAALGAADAAFEITLHAAQLEYMR